MPRVSWLCVTTARSYEFPLSTMSNAKPSTVSSVSILVLPVATSRLAGPSSTGSLCTCPTCRPRLSSRVQRPVNSAWEAISRSLLHQGHAIGVIGISRQRRGPFPDRHIELLKTFADQAVIAIENVRLFTELQQKNEALTQAHAQVTEAMEQQTATSEILRVISQSPPDVQPVLDAVAENAARLCGADDAVIRHVEGDTLQLVARFGSIPLPDPTRPISRDYPAGL